ncbi:MAG: nucleoside monophosphate kinase [Phycisphaeraceae bacterium]|nr:nucleoside monophosphate kinase [Phycisphaeraceae bacterium]
MSGQQRFKTVLLFGAPGAGKGTQGKILGAIPGVLHMSSGDMFRGMDPESRLGKIFREYSTRGELVPDEVTIDLWQEHVGKLRAGGKYDPTTQLLVLDGIPRNVNQAALLDGVIDVLKVIHLAFADEKEAISRLKKRAMKENRADDAKEDVIRRRLDVYRDETRPLLDHYAKDRIADVDALGSPAQVLLEVLKVVAPLQATYFGNALA